MRREAMAAGAEKPMTMSRLVVSVTTVSVTGKLKSMPLSYER